MNLTELQELMQLELGTPICAWMSSQLMKGIWKFECASFLDLLQEFDSNPFGDDFIVYLQMHNIGKMLSIVRWTLSCQMGLGRSLIIQTGANQLNLQEEIKS
jgi:hypothetical protein